jgi:hypothetical protein
VGNLDAASLFNGAIFGDNTTILVGSHSNQTVSNAMVKGDFEALAKVLREYGVPEGDITDLQQAVDADKNSPDVAQKKIGPGVRAWMSKMLAKAVDAAWQIELGIAGGLLTGAIQRFYGWP